MNDYCSTKRVAYTNIPYSPGVLYSSVRTFYAGDINIDIFGSHSVAVGLFLAC